MMHMGGSGTTSTFNLPPPWHCHSPLHPEASQHFRSCPPLLHLHHPKDPETTPKIEKPLY